MQILALNLILAAAAVPAPATSAPPKQVYVAADDASAQRPRFMVAPKFGLFEPTSRMSGAFFAGIEAGYLTPALDDKLAVVLEVDWVRPRAAGTVTDPRVLSAGETYTLGNAEVGFLLSAIYRFEGAFPLFTPYGGAGPGLFLQRTATNAFGSTYIETESRIGLQALLGCDLAIGPGAGFVEFRYHFSRVDFLSTGATNVGGFLALGLGYRFRF